MTLNAMLETLSTASVGDAITADMITVAKTEFAKVTARKSKEDSKKTAEYAPLATKMLEELHKNGTMFASVIASHIGVNTSKIIHIAKFLGDKVTIGETITEGRVVKTYTAND